MMLDIIYRVVLIIALAGLGLMCFAVAIVIIWTWLDDRRFVRQHDEWIKRQHS